MQFRRICGELARSRGSTVASALPRFRPPVTPDVHILFGEAGQHRSGRP